MKRKEQRHLQAFHEVLDDCEFIRVTVLLGKEGRFVSGWIGVLQTHSGGVLFLALNW